MNPQPRLVEVRQNVLRQNDVVARALRQRFQGAGMFVVSLVFTLLREKHRVAALVGDLATRTTP